MSRTADRFRIASVQWDMRKPACLPTFLDRIDFFCTTAAEDYAAELVIFPEYFTLPLAALTPAPDPITSIHQLAGLTESINDHLATLAIRHGIWILGGSQPVIENNRLLNIAFLFGPEGQRHRQEKLHITPWEKSAWQVHGGNNLEVIDLGKIKIGIQICYDVEFPEPTRRLADAGMELLLVPYCTDDRRGHLRVTRCAMARTIENQIAVATAGCVGILTNVPAANLHHAESGIYTPIDIPFPRDGIAATATPNTEELLIAEINLTTLRASRADGTVTPLKDRRHDLFP